MERSQKTLRAIEKKLTKELADRMFPASRQVPSNRDPVELLTVGETSAILRVSEKTVRRYISKGILPAAQLAGPGSRIFIDRIHINRLLSTFVHK